MLLQWRVARLVQERLEAEDSVDVLQKKARSGGRWEQNGGRGWEADTSAVFSG